MAHTCGFEVDLPEYVSKEELEDANLFCPEYTGQHRCAKEGKQKGRQWGGGHPQEQERGREEGRTDEEVGRDQHCGRADPEGRFDRRRTNCEVM